MTQETTLNCVHTFWRLIVKAQLLGVMFFGDDSVVITIVLTSSILALTDTQIRVIGRRPTRKDHKYVMEIG
jgi:hypothetical protein